MSHAIYSTSGIVLKSLNFGEANKLYLIFTKDFGLIKATAQGVRLLKSKLRFNLEDYSRGNFSLVRGQEVWRLTAAEKEISLSHLSNFFVLQRIFSLLLRLLQGEEKNENLFEIIAQGIDFLKQLVDLENSISPQFLSNFECILALRILSNLGYLAQNSEFGNYLSTPYFDLALLQSFERQKTQAIFEINKSLKETHL